MAIDTITIAQLIKDQQITMTAERCDSNPNMNDSSNMDHWKVVLTRKVLRVGACQYSTRKLTTYFSMGYGHNGKQPSAADVLECLASDSYSIDNALSFEDWASDLGYDIDSRKAERTWKACEHAANRLRNFMGDAYDDLLSAERL